jgi:hypothetical protein
MSDERRPANSRHGTILEDASVVAAVERLRARQSRRARFGRVAGGVAFAIVGLVAIMRILRVV